MVHGRRVEIQTKTNLTSTKFSYENMEPRASIRKHFELSDFHMEPRASTRKHFELSDFHMEPRASIRKHFANFHFHEFPLPHHIYRVIIAHRKALSPNAPADTPTKSLYVYVYTCTIDQLDPVIFFLGVQSTPDACSNLKRTT